MQQLNDPLAGVQADDGRYRVYDHGAQVCAWQPADDPRPVLWMSSASAFTPGKAIRGGIPICFPWFGPGLSEDKKPAHGFARTTSWRRVTAAESNGVLTVEYAIDPELTGEQPEFPHRYEASLTAVFADDHLELSLRASNTGDQPFTFEEALHTYLVVSDVRDVTIEGLDGATYCDKLADSPGFDSVQQGDLRLSGPTDSVFEHQQAVAVSDPGYGRRLVLSSSGASNVVVWNPWESGAAGMADMGPGEWSGMVCVEAGNVLNGAVTLEPGEDWTISQRIEVHPLP